MSARGEKEGDGQRKRERESARAGDSKEGIPPRESIALRSGSVCGYLLDVGYPSAASLSFSTLSASAAHRYRPRNVTRGFETSSWPAGGSP